MEKNTSISKKWGVFYCFVEEMVKKVKILLKKQGDNGDKRVTNGRQIGRNMLG